jgi:hypothetical protein
MCRNRGDLLAVKVLAYELPVQPRIHGAIEAVLSQGKYHPAVDGTDQQLINSLVTEPGAASFPGLSPIL